MHEKIKELKFQSLHEGSQPDQEIARTKSGHASNDQGYDSGEESLDHNSKQSYEKNNTSNIGVCVFQLNVLNSIKIHFMYMALIKHKRIWVFWGIVLQFFPNLKLLFA
jgi:hypothetical protein